MLAKDVINHVLPVLKSADTVGDALGWMDEYRVGQLAIVENAEYRGLISQDILLEADEELPLLALQPGYQEVFVLAEQHLYEVLSVAQKHELEVIVVLDEERKYSGTIVVTELLNILTKKLGSQELGAIIEIALENRSYSLSEISRLIEANDTKIISSYYTTGDESSNFKDILTLKLNRRDITPVVATLERFEYQIIGAYSFESIETPDKERFDLLMKYLDL
ncbi:CBS domain-containing protein [Flectobacillus major]|uniref:CBS domain-containing protein n=1 Tax=Flectobacillus major TaxID=103 RepID=UPI0003FB339C|nr:CBS domain-containing protein [Flectobacillus major]